MFVDEDDEISESVITLILLIFYDFSVPILEVLYDFYEFWQG